jgi:glycosyltransferase involved in cell wall biosynthesis
MNLESNKGEEHSHKRILLLAYACSPYRGSEAGVGWNRAIETAKYFDTWVICKQNKYAKEINKWISENGKIPGLYFCFLPRTIFEIFLKGIPGLWYLAYNLWHRRAYYFAKRLHNEFHFDLVHQITNCGFREPGYLWKLDIPFIWGPVAGTNNYPWRFLFAGGIKSAVIEGCRSLINIIQFRFSKRVRKALQHATLFLTANSEGKKAFKRVYKVEPILELDIGTPSVVDRSSSIDYQHKGPLRILWSSAFLYHKALHLLFDALEGIPTSVPYELKILGDGPLKKRWKNLAVHNGVQDHCNWMGWLPHDQALAQYEWADIFAFTSMRDACGTVVLEALSHGVPVICFDHQGAGDVVTEECGIKIRVTNYEEAVSRLQKAIIDIAQDRNRLSRLSGKAVERASEYLWSLKGKKMVELYSKVLKMNDLRERACASILCGQSNSCES